MVLENCSSVACTRNSAHAHRQSHMQLHACITLSPAHLECRAGRGRGVCIWVMLRQPPRPHEGLEVGRHGLADGAQQYTQYTRRLGAYCAAGVHEQAAVHVDPWGQRSHQVRHLPLGDDGLQVLQRSARKRVSGCACDCAGTWAFMCLCIYVCWGAAGVFGGGRGWGALHMCAMSCMCRPGDVACSGQVRCMACRGHANRAKPCMRHSSCRAGIIGCVLLFGVPTCRIWYNPGACHCRSTLQEYTAAATACGRCVQWQRSGRSALALTCRAFNLVVASFFDRCLMHCAISPSTWEETTYSDASAGPSDAPATPDAAMARRAAVAAAPNPKPGTFAATAAPPANLSLAPSPGNSRAEQRSPQYSPKTV